MHIISLDLEPKQLCELSVVWYNALRRLGFTPEEIYFSPYVKCSKTHHVVWGIVLMVGDKTWTSAIGRSTETPWQFSERWEKYAGNEMQHMTEDQVHALWTKHMPLQLFQDVIGSINAKSLPVRSLGL
jgi:hypothetical protein